MANYIINSIITQNTDLIGTTSDGTSIYNQIITESVFCNYEIHYQKTGKSGLASEFCSRKAKFNTFEECYVEAHKIAELTDLLKAENSSLIICHVTGIRFPNGEEHKNCSELVRVLPDGKIELLHCNLRGLYRLYK